MRITLRSIVLTPVVMVAAALTANSAMAETKVNVPFNFSVDGKTCPAGQYSVQADRWGNSVRLEGASHVFTWLIRPGDPAPTDKRVILKFDEIGSSHLLRSVQYRDEVTSRLDKRAREIEAAVERDIQGQ
jgi:hypothetical protein